MFQNANPGLNSRFPHWIEFEDYSADEMAEIFKIILDEKGYKLEKGGSSHLQRLIKATKKSNFGNGRGVRNLVDSVIGIQSIRLANVTNIDELAKEDYQTIANDDLITLTEDISVQTDTRNRIGF